MRGKWHFGFLVMFMASTANGQFGAKPVAIVNGEPITRAEFDAVVQLRPVAVTPRTTAQKRAEAEEIVNALIDESLLRQFVTKNAPPAKPEEIEQQFSALVSGLKAQHKTVADYCKETMQTEKQIRANIESMIRWNGYIANKRNDAELYSYFTQNKDYFDKVTVKCSHIVFRVGSDAPAAEKATAMKKLQELRVQIAGNKMSFAEAAQKYSQCPSAPKGGNLGYIYRKWMVEEPFARAAFALKVNEMSDVVLTDYGMHLILVTDRKPPEASEFSKVKDEVRECYSEEMRQNLLTELRKSAKIEINLP